MVAFVRFSSLDGKADGLGLSCGGEGVRLAGVPLLTRTDHGFEPRSLIELQVLLRAAYGREFDVTSLTRGLKVAACSLEESDLGKAMIAAIHLRLPDLDPAGAKRIAEADGFLAKYSPDQPRDWHGRWTTGDGDSTATMRSPLPAQSWSPAPVQTETSDWSGGHLSGGQFYLTDADPDDDTPESESLSEPLQDPTRPEPEPRPPGWETPEGIVPRLSDGRIWPAAQASPMLRALLAARADGRPPQAIIYVPDDLRGPMLMGMTDKEEFVEPKGYSSVMLIGTPQVTRSGGAETRHADDSLEQGLQLANTNRFSMVFFNRSFSTITSGEHTFLIRPDVTAVVRPELELGYRLWPYESLSPGQMLPERQNEMPPIKGLRSLEGKPYLKVLIKILQSMGLIG